MLNRGFRLNSARNIKSGCVVTEADLYEVIKSFVRVLKVMKKGKILFYERLYIKM